MSWITWVDDDKASANCTSLLLAESEHSLGFQAGGPAKSKNVNAALRQANLIGCALMDIVDPTGTLSGLSARSTVKTKLQNYFNTYATKAGLEDGSIVPKNSTNAANATHALSATSATYAQYADTDTSKGTIDTRLRKVVYKTKDLGSISEAKQYLRYPHSFVYYASPSGTVHTYDCFYSDGSFYYISSGGSITKVTGSFSIDNYVRVIYVDLAGV